MPDDRLNDLMRQTETLYLSISQFTRSVENLAGSDSPLMPGLREARSSVKTARRALLKAMRARKRGA